MSESDKELLEDFREGYGLLLEEVIEIKDLLKKTNEKVDELIEENNELREHMQCIHYAALDEDWENDQAWNFVLGHSYIDDSAGEDYDNDFSTSG